MLKNKRVVKALTIGLATVLATPSMTAFAAEPAEQNEPKAEPAAVEASVIDASAVERTVVPVESTNREAIDNANALVEQAKELEEGVKEQALEQLNPFDGMPDAALGIVAGAEDNDIYLPNWDKDGFSFKDKDDSAAEFEENASDALDNKENGAAAILDNAEEDIQKDIDYINNQLDSYKSNTHEAAKAAGTASEEAAKSEAARDAANAASTSGAASVQAGLAVEAANAAKEAATAAEGYKESAYTAFKNAEERFTLAKEKAEAANEAANEAIANGDENADKAVKMAQVAENAAIGLQKEMEFQRGLAEQTKEYYEGELDRVAGVLKFLGDQKDVLEGLQGDAKEEYKAQLENWGKMYNAVIEAQLEYTGASNPFMLGYYKDKVDRLRKTLEDADKALSEFEAAKLTADSDKADKRADAVDAAKDYLKAYDAFYYGDAKYAGELALHLLKGAYQQALSEYESAKANAEAIGGENGSIAQLKAEYGENIGDIQNAILGKNTEDETLTKDIAVATLIGKVAKSETVATSIPGWENKFPNGLFTANDKFYTYEVDDNGVIYVIECDHQVTEELSHLEVKYDGEAVTGISEANLAAALEGLKTGEYELTPVTQENVLVGYTISYRDTESYSSTATYTNNQPGTYTEGNKPRDAKYMIDGYVQGNGNGKKKYTGWAYTKGGKWYAINGNQLNKLSISVVKTKEIKVSELDSYSTKIVGEPEEIRTDITTYTLKKYVIKSESGLTEEEYNEKKAKLEADGLFVRSDEPEETAGGYRVVYPDNGDADINEAGNYSTVQRDEFIADAKEKYGWEDWVYTFENGFGFYYTLCVYDPKAPAETNTLRFVNGRWEAYVWKNQWQKEWKVLPTTGTTLMGTVYIREVETVSENKIVKNKYDQPDVGLNDSNTYKFLMDQRAEGDTTYTIYYKDSEKKIDQEASESYDLTDTKTNLQNLANLYEQLSKSNKIVAKVDTKNAFEEALRKYNEAKAAAEKAATDLQNKKDYDKAKREYDEKISAKNEAWKKLGEAKRDLFGAGISLGAARAKLDGINKALSDNAFWTRIADNRKTRINTEISNASAAITYWDGKAATAKSLAEAATAAREKAEEAAAALEALKNTSNVGVQALALAEQELADARLVYEAAKAAADLAAQDAEKARKAADAALARVQALIDAENAAAGAGEGEGAGEATTGGADVLATIPTGEEVPGAPAAPVAGGAGVAANAAPAAAEATTVDIAPQNSALAATVPEDNKSDDGLATILPQGPALAADIADTEHLTWWWLLVVAVLGGTGYAMYKKFQTKKEEKVTK